MKKLIFTLIIFSNINSFAGWEFWNTLSAKNTLSLKEKITVSEQTYFSSFISGQYQQVLSCSYSNNVHKILGLYGELYSQTSILSNNERKGDFYLVPGFFTNLNIDKKLSFSLMDRFFYSSGGKGKFDHKRLTLSLSLKTGDYEFSLADESRFDLSKERSASFYQNRLYFGTERKLTKTLSLKLSWIIQQDKTDNKFKSKNIAQSNISFYF